MRAVETVRSILDDVRRQLVWRTIWWRPVAVVIVAAGIIVTWLVRSGADTLTITQRIANGAFAARGFATSERSTGTPRLAM